jgi:hypothetical protein
MEISERNTENIIIWRVFVQERIINIIITFTLSVMAFTLVAFGFHWVYELWIAEELSRGWLVPFIAIPSVAIISALLIYLFVYAIGAEGREESSYPYN